MSDVALTSQWDSVSRLLTAFPSCPLKELACSTSLIKLKIYNLCYLTVVAVNLGCFNVIILFTFKQ